MRKKLLIVCEYFPPHVGGAEKLFGLHAKHLGESGKYEIRVVTSLQVGALQKENMFPNCQIFRYPWKGLFGHPIGSFSDIASHVRWADIVHTTTYSCALQSLILSRYYRKNIVLTIFEVLDKKWFRVATNFFSGLIYYLVEKIILTLPFSALHAISKHTFDNLQANPKYEKTSVIYPFQESAVKVLNNNKRGDYYLFFGRAGRTKGLYLLVEALLLLKSQGIEPTCILIIADHPDSDRKQIVDTIKQNQLRNVTIKSQQPAEKLQDYITGAKAVIVPSLTEGFGYSAYEASQLGTPVIYSSDTSLGEVVSYGREFENGNRASLAEILNETEQGIVEWERKAVNIDNTKLTAKWFVFYKGLT